MQTKVDGAAANYDRDPDECPICRRGCAPKLIASSATASLNYDQCLLELAFVCTFQNCRRLFIASYAWSDPSFFAFKRSQPVEPREPAIPSEVRETSESFVRIYTEAAAAEELGLGEIAGVGYRKALEFLVKDYCIGQDPEHGNAIKSKPLAQCIREHIIDEKLRACAERAAWLGNDETHYVRLWEDNDLGDLKALIGLTMSWIETNVRTERYLKAMPPRGGRGGQ